MSDNGPTEAEVQLAEYARSYMEEFNSQRDQITRMGRPASLYGNELVAATIFVAQDGMSIIYIDETTRIAASQSHNGELPRGVSLIDLSDKTLAHITQAMSANFIKIYEHSTGDRIFDKPRLACDLPTEQLQGGVNPRVLEPYLDKVDPGPNLTGIAVSPCWHIEQGIFVNSIPTRCRVFTPFIPVAPSNEPLLQFFYPFIDLIWGPEELKLNADAGKQFARVDIEVLLLGIAASIPSVRLAQDPFSEVASHCENVCNDLLAMIDNPETIEKQVQDFLEQPPHRFLLCPHSTNIIPQKTLSGLRFRIDFAVQRPDSDYHLIEIESPNSLIYQAKGEEPTALFTHAIQQVEDWLRYIEDNRTTVRTEDEMPTIQKPTGEVIIGRDQHLGGNARKRFDFKRGENHRIKLKTYDMMIAEGRAYAAALRRMKRATSE